MAFTNISKPTTAFSGISEMFNMLMINSTDFLLINSVDRLGISKSGKDLYGDLSKPTTVYSKITDVLSGLLINSVDRLLIDDDCLLMISDKEYSSTQKPNTNYNSIVKPT